MNPRTVPVAVIAAASILLGGGSIALSQQSAALPGAGTYQEAKDGKLTVQPFNLTVDQMDDMDVMGTDGARIGEIEEVLTDASGQLAAVVIEVENGVGLRDKDVIVGLDQLRLDGKSFVTGLSKEQIGGLPVWDD